MEFLQNETYGTEVKFRIQYHMFHSDYVTEKSRKYNVLRSSLIRTRFVTATATQIYQIWI